MPNNKPHKRGTDATNATCRVFGGFSDHHAIGPNSPNRGVSRGFGKFPNTFHIPSGIDLMIFVTRRNIKASERERPGRTIRKRLKQGNFTMNAIYTNKSWARKAMTILIDNMKMFEAVEEPDGDYGIVGGRYLLGVKFHAGTQGWVTVLPVDESDLNEIRCLTQ
jgi:hypothetical protein